jgi:ABC-type antimicrobial peptide transport system permease subunit
MTELIYNLTNDVVPNFASINVMLIAVGVIILIGIIAGIFWAFYQGLN